MRDIGDTKRTGRYKTGTLLVGQNQRTPAAQAAITDMIARYGLTTINAETFGFLASNSFDESVAITASGTTLTSANNPWTSGDVGKSIYVQGAGVAGATLVTTIDSFTSAGEIELTDAASTTVAPSATSAAGLAVWGTAFVATFAIERDLSPDGLTEELDGSLPGAGPAIPAAVIPTPNTLVLRDAFGRSEIQDPVDPLEIDNLQARNAEIGSQVGAEASARQAADTAVVGLIGPAVASAVSTANSFSTNLVNNHISAGVHDKLSITAAEDVVAAGTDRASATLLSLASGAHRITAAAAGTGVVFPAATGSLGILHLIENRGANAAQVYFDGSETVDDVAGSVGISIPAGGSVIVQETLTGIWYSFGLFYPSSPGPIGNVVPGSVKTTTLETTGESTFGKTAHITPSLTNATTANTTLDARNSNNQAVSIQADTEIAISNPTSGDVLTLELIGHATGPFDVTFAAANFDWTTSVSDPGPVTVADGTYHYLTLKYTATLNKWRVLSVNLDD